MNKSSIPGATNAAPAAPDTPNATGQNATPAARRNKELLYAGIGIGTGLLVLPLMIYMVGILIIGPYAGGKSMGAFYLEFFANLGRGELRTWFIALSPYLAIWLVRLCFKRWGRKASAPPIDPSESEPLAQSASGVSRREPFIGA